MKAFFFFSDKWLFLRGMGGGVLGEGERVCVKSKKSHSNGFVFIPVQKKYRF